MIKVGQHTAGRRRARFVQGNTRKGPRRTESKVAELLELLSVRAKVEVDVRRRLCRQIL